jgi:hypothetical protein
VSKGDETNMIVGHDPSLSRATGSRFYHFIRKSIGTPFGRSRARLAGYWIGGLLWDLVEHAHRRDWPLPSTIVVNKPNIGTGDMEPETLKGFFNAARQLPPAGAPVRRAAEQPPLGAGWQFFRLACAHLPAHDKVAATVGPT